MRLRLIEKAQVGISRLQFLCTTLDVSSLDNTDLFELECVGHVFPIRQPSVAPANRSCRRSATSIRDRVFSPLSKSMSFASTPLSPLLWLPRQSPSARLRRAQYSRNRHFLHSRPGSCGGTTTPQLFTVPDKTGGFISISVS
jgi:hypothetical protein